MRLPLNHSIHTQESRDHTLKQGKGYLRMKQSSVGMRVYVYEHSSWINWQSDTFLRGL